MEWRVSLWPQPPPCGPTLFSSEPPGLLEPRAPLLPRQELAEGAEGGHVFLPSCSSEAVGQGRLLGGHASVPGPRPSTQGRPKVCELRGYSPNLASAVSFRIFSYYGERRPSGSAGHLCTSSAPGPHPAVRMPGIQGGREGVTHLPASGSLSGQRGGGPQGHGDSGALHSHRFPVPEGPSAPGYTAASASRRTEGKGLASARPTLLAPPRWAAGSKRAGM